MADKATETDRAQQTATKRNQALPLGEAFVAAPVTKTAKVGEVLKLDVSGNTVVKRGLPLTQIGEQVVGSTVRKNTYRLARGGSVMEE